MYFYTSTIQTTVEKFRRSVITALSARKLICSLYSREAPVQQLGGADHASQQQGQNVIETSSKLTKIITMVVIPPTITCNKYICVSSWKTNISYRYLQTWTVKQWYCDHQDNHMEVCCRHRAILRQACLLKTRQRQLYFRHSITRTKSIRAV